MFDHRTKTAGVNTAPKAEMVTTSGAYTKKRLYLVPIRVRAFTVFDTFDWDFALKVGLLTTMSYTAGVYKRTGALSASTAAATLVAGMSVTVTGATAAFQTTALGSTKTLVPGDYFIAFIFDVVGAGTCTLTSPNSVANNTWITGDWVYVDQATFALPAAVGGAVTGQVLLYIHAGSQSPFWAALHYSGDVLP